MSKTEINNWNEKLKKDVYYNDEKKYHQIINFFDFNKYNSMN